MSHFFNSLIPEDKPSSKLLTKQATKLIGRRATRRGKKKSKKTAAFKKQFDEAMIEHKRVRRIPLMSYRLYMGSAYWKKRKNDYFGKHGKQCAICGQKSGVTLHHKVYEAKLFGKEPDEHLVALCPHHHKEFHDNFTLSANMQKDTNDYVDVMSRLKNSNIDDLSWI